MKWEYKTLKLAAKGFLGGKVDENSIDELLNKLGGEGWELVSAFDTNFGEGATRDVIFILKRAV